MDNLRQKSLLKRSCFNLRLTCKGLINYTADVINNRATLFTQNFSSRRLVCGVAFEIHQPKATLGLGGLDPGLLDANVGSVAERVKAPFLWRPCDHDCVI